MALRIKVKKLRKQAEFPYCLVILDETNERWEIVLTNEDLENLYAACVLVLRVREAKRLKEMEDAEAKEQANRPQA